MSAQRGRGPAHPLVQPPVVPSHRSTSPTPFHTHSPAIPQHSAPPPAVHAPPLQPQHHAYGSQHPIAESPPMGPPSIPAAASYYGLPSEASSSDPGHDQPVQQMASSHQPAGHTYSEYAPSSIDPPSSPSYSPAPSTSFPGRVPPPLTATSKRSRLSSSTTSPERSTKKTRVDQTLVKLQLQEQNLAEAIQVIDRWYQALRNQGPDAHQAYLCAVSWLSLINKSRQVGPAEFERTLQLRAPKIGEPIFETLNEAIEDYIKARQLAWEKTAPTPSQFANCKSWEVHQARDPILCFRPCTAAGLPIQALYEGFRQFTVDMHDPDFNISYSAYQAAEDLCNSMGNSFLNEDARATEFKQAIRPLLPDWRSEFYVKPFEDQSYGRVDRAAATGTLIEVKLEDGGSYTSAFMQLCLCFRLYVQSLKQKGGSFVDAGCPTFLLAVQGVRLTIYGAFWDGTYTVESLTDGGLLMLGDYAGRTQAKLAHALAALEKAHMEIWRISQRNPKELDKTKIACGPGRTPQAYRTCTLYDTPDAQATLVFLRRLVHHNSQPVWLAEMTTTSDTSSSSTTEVIVKLPRTYGADVHHYLHGLRYAPKLLGSSNLPEVPCVYVMEYLPPPWKTLFDLIRTDSALFLRHKQEIFDKITTILRCLKEGGFVHGDLRSNNIMIHSDALVGDDVQIKVVDFDWSGVAKVAAYPGRRTRTGAVAWPGLDGGKIGVDHDAALFSSWWNSRSACQPGWSLLNAA